MLSKVEVIIVISLEDNLFVEEDKDISFNLLELELELGYGDDNNS